ncbi:MAG: hypothetical protein HZB50_17680 [Chloroflexi bacterium]|nr:hypothetical protein [Chloroflexota bacterium]
MTTSSSLVSFFTTLAQISFTVAGLMAIAIAGDSKRREYWLENKSRSLFVYINFLILLLPGFISIGGLIPQSPNTVFTAWMFTALSFGLLYSNLAVIFFFRKRKLDDPEEFKRLEKRFFKVNLEMGILGWAMIISSIGGYAACYTLSITDYSNAETYLGIMLFLAMTNGAITSVTLLRANELPSNEREDIGAISQPRQNLIIERSNSNSSLFVFTTLIVAIIAFLIGIFTKNRDN